MEKENKMINQYRKLETSAKKREIYVPNKFFLFYILHPLSQSARSPAKFSICYDIFFFDCVKTPFLAFVNMRSVLVFSLVLSTPFLIIVDAIYWISTYKKDTPCKLERIFENLKHFKTY